MDVSRNALSDLSPHNLFKRCVQCPDTVPPCPSCAGDEVCSQTAQSCDRCAFSQCVKTSVSGSTNNGQVTARSSGPNIGAIVGGVVGGILVISVISFLLWKFCLKGRRHPIEEEWEEYPPEKTNNDFAMQRSERASVHTVQSMASTVLTRASNIIQIAYIPGVTNRANAGSPGLLVPPVPPIPSATTNSSAPGTPSYSIEDQHFFVPGDLRDSTYSGNSDGRNSTYTRNSISPSLARSSVATTIYRNNAIVSPTPAQAAIRSKPAIISVRNGQSPSGSASGTPGNVTPPVPSIDYQRFNNNNNANAPSPLRDGSVQRPVMVQMPSSSDSIPRPSMSSSQRSGAPQGPTFVGKPTAITMTKGGKTKQRGDDASSSITSTTTRSAESYGLGFSSSLGRPHSQTNSIDSGLTHARAQRAVTQRRDSDVDDDSDLDSTDPHSRSRHSLLGDNLRALAAMRDIEVSSSSAPQDSPPSLMSPFTDASHSSPSPNPSTEDSAAVRKSSGMLSSVAEAEERSRPVSHQRPLKVGRRRGMEREESDGNRSPFEDEHEVRS